MSGFIISNSGGGAPSGVAGGDLSGSYPNPGVAKIAGIAITGTPSSGNIIIATSSTAASWQASSAGFTAAGDLSGTSSSQTVIKINGATVPAAGALTTGQVLQVSGASATTYAALNLGTAASITGTLPAGNQAAQTLTGDVIGNTGANTLTLAGDVTGRAGVTVVGKLQGNPVQSGTNGATQDGYVLTWVNASTQYQAKPAASGFTAAGDLSGTSSTQTVISLTGSSGKVNIASTGNVITWAAATTAPGITQATQTSDAATASLTLTTQAPFASATTNKSPGSMIFNIPAQVAGGTEGSFRFQEAGNNILTINTDGNGPTGWLQLLMAANNSLISTAGGVSLITGSTATPIQFQPGSIAIAGMTNKGVQLCSQTAAFGGGTGVIGITNATVNPTTNPAGGVVLYSELTTGNLKNRGSLGSITTVAVPGSNLTINSQKQIIDGYIGTCETVSSATPTVIMNYPTVSGTGGLLTLSVVSRATTTAGGVTAGDTATNRYVLAYKNVSGTITLSTAGIVVDGTAPAQTTNATLTAPVLTTAIVGNVIQFLVTNAAVDTVDSQCYLTANVC